MNHWLSTLRLLITGFILLTVFASTASAAGPVGPSDPSQIGNPEHFTKMVIYASVALFFSFLCSVAEAVVLSLSPSYIANLRSEGKESAANLLDKVKRNIDRSLAAILTLNTIAHTVGAGGAGAEAAAYFGDDYVGISMAVLTLLILFLSEIIPKTIGAVYWRSLAPLTGQFIQWLIWILFPLIIVSEFLTKFLTSGKGHHDFSREEFRAMVDVGTEAGQLDENESRILGNLFKFPTLTAEDIMTPRTVLFSLQQDMSVQEVMEKHPQLVFSRIPVYAANRDEMTGFILKSDLLIALAGKDAETTKLSDIKREIGGVHDDEKLTKVLERMLDTRAHILLVYGDHGGLHGVVTLEDVVETLIGTEIVDEVDTIDDMRILARKKWESRMNRMGIALDQKEQTTVVEPEKVEKKPEE